MLEKNRRASLMPAPVPLSAARDGVPFVAGLSCLRVRPVMPKPTSPLRVFPETSLAPRDPAGRADQPPYTADSQSSAPENPGVGTSPGLLCADRLCRPPDGNDTARSAWTGQALREARLPAPLGAPPDDLCATLVAAAAAQTGCRGAAFYLLDEQTQYLRLRAAHGLDSGAAQQRELAGAVADLEALLGHAVVLDSPDMLVGWQPPVVAAAAACVPVATESTVLGTLWVFADEPRAFSDLQTLALERVAARLAALTTAPQPAAAQPPRQLAQELRAAAHWQADRLPKHAPPVAAWDAAGWVGSREVVSPCFFDWQIRSDGSLLIALGCATEDGLVGALDALALRHLLQGLSHGPLRPPHVLIRSVRDACEQSSPTGAAPDLALVVAAPTHDSLAIAGSGRLQVLLRREHWQHCPLSRTHLAAPQAVWTTHQRLSTNEALALIALPSGRCCEEPQPADAPLWLQQTQGVRATNILADIEQDYRRAWRQPPLPGSLFVLRRR